METARAFGMTDLSLGKDDFKHCLAEWSDLSVMLNEMNRSVGQYDAYPFVLSAKTSGKLTFVHESIALYHRHHGSASRTEEPARA
jgi:hypothetical protein